MITGAHVVVASKDPKLDQAFFRDILKLPAIDAGGGYVIFGLPVSEASIHGSDGEVPHHELFFLCENIEVFRKTMAEREIECSEPKDTGWGRLVTIRLPSGSPFSVYEPRHARPSDT